MYPEVKDLILYDNDPAYLPSYKACLTKQHYVFTPQGSILYPGDWMDIKIQAAERTRIFFTSYTKKKVVPMIQDDDNDDEDVPPGVNQNKGKVVETPITPGLHAEEVKFIQALPYNIPLELGFLTTPTDISQKCFCPCCPALDPWREKYLLITAPDKSCKSSLFKPEDLVDHLVGKGGKDGDVREIYQF